MLWNAVLWAWHSQCNPDLTAVNIVCNRPANEWASQESFTNWEAVNVFLSITDELLATEWFWGQGLPFCSHNEPTRLQCIFTFCFVASFYSCSSDFDSLKFFKKSSMKWMIWVLFSPSYSGLHCRLDSASAAFSNNFHLFFSSLFCLLFVRPYSHSCHLNWVNLTHSIDNTFCWLTFIGGIFEFESHFVFLLLLLWASVWVLSILAWA